MTLLHYNYYNILRTRTIILCLIHSKAQYYLRLRPTRGYQPKQRAAGAFCAGAYRLAA